MTSISRWPSAVGLRRYLNVFAILQAMIGLSLAAQAPAKVLPNLQPQPQPRPGPVLDTIWRVGGAEDLGGVSFGILTDVAIDSSGRILAADYINQNIQVLDQHGRPIRTLGRKGDGPGEFRLPYRVAVAPDGMIYVWDLYQGRVSEFDSDLEFIRTILLQPTLTAHQFAAGQSVLTLGGAERRGDRAPAVIHQFARSDGRRIRSFGQLLPATSPRLMYEVGSGPMAVGPGGETWYVTPGPYRLELYSPEGVRQLSLERPNDFLGPVEDRFTVTVFEGSESIRLNQDVAAMAAIALKPGGVVEVAELLGDGRYVVEEFHVSEAGGTVSAMLTRSSVVPAPYLMPRQMLRHGEYLVTALDEDRVAELMLVRVRSGGR